MRTRPYGLENQIKIGLCAAFIHPADGSATEKSQKSGTSFQ
jgi:hypothetical protein